MALCECDQQLTCRKRRGYRYIPSINRVVAKERIRLTGEVGRAHQNIDANLLREGKRDDDNGGHGENVDHSSRCVTTTTQHVEGGKHDEDRTKPANGPP